MPAASAPVFRLYLLRHAKAAWALPGQKDFDRTLDDAGFADAEIVADIAADRGLRPDLVLCSTAVRCRQTADALRRAMTEDLDIRYIDALYAGERISIATSSAARTLPFRRSWSSDTIR
jgi:phosphohistidine phosphatase